MQLQTVGVRGMVEELLNAMDSTLVRIKLRTACVTALVTTGTLALAGVFSSVLAGPWDLVLWIVAGLVALVAGSIGSTLLTQMTFIELSHARPAHWADATAGLGRTATRLAFSYLLLVGVPLLIILLLPRIPGWFLSAEGSAGQVLAGILLVLDLILIV